MANNQPTKSYLVMMNLLKHDISIARIVVPALLTLKVIDVVDSIKVSCETVMRQAFNDINQSISFLEDFLVKELQRTKAQSICRYLLRMRLQSA